MAEASRPTEADIRRMVESFYARVRDDSLLAPVFEVRVSEWAIHLDRMTAFWTSVLLARPGYRGDPIGKHRAIPELTPTHFDRWLELFGEVVSEQFEAGIAADIHGRAVRMRMTLQPTSD